MVTTRTIRLPLHVILLRPVRHVTIVSIHVGRYPGALLAPELKVILKVQPRFHSLKARSVLPKNVHVTVAHLDRMSYREVHL